MDLTTDFCGISLRNPFLLAASPCTDDEGMVRNAFEAGWAGAVLKTTSIPGQEVSLVYPMMSEVTSFPNPPGLLPGGEALRRRTHQVTANASCAITPPVIRSAASTG